MRIDFFDVSGLRKKRRHSISSEFTLVARGRHALLVTVERWLATSFQPRPGAQLKYFFALERGGRRPLLFLDATHPTEIRDFFLFLFLLRPKFKK